MKWAVIGRAVTLKNKVAMGQKKDRVPGGPDRHVQPTFGKGGRQCPHQYFLIKNNVVVYKFPSYITVEKSVCFIHFHKELFKC